MGSSISCNGPSPALYTCEELQTPLCPEQRNNRLFSACDLSQVAFHVQACGVSHNPLRSAYPVSVCCRLQLAPGKACLVLDVAEGQRRQCPCEGGRAQACGIGGE